MSVLCTSVIGNKIATSLTMRFCALTPDNDSYASERRILASAANARQVLAWAVDEQAPADVRVVFSGHAIYLQRCYAG
jgi:hypothetical protein